MDQTTPWVFKHIKKSDVTWKPFKAYKHWHATNTNYSSSYGIQILRGRYPFTIIPLSSSANLIGEAINHDGSYEKVIYPSVKHLFYNGLTSYDQLGEYTQPQFIVKNLYDTCSIVGIPLTEVGQGIKPNSVSISSSCIISASLSTGFKYPTKITQYTGSNPLSDIKWSNLNNATGSTDSKFAQVSKTGITFVGSYLMDLYGYGFNIPSNSIINGIEVQVVRKSSVVSGLNYSRDNIVAVNRILSGSYTGSNLATNQEWSASLQTVTYGSGNQLWGQSWKASDINSGSFGVQYQASINHTVSASVDSIGVNIFYSSPTPSKIHLKDDGYGNLYDYSVSTGSMPLRTNLVSYISFNDKFTYNRKTVKIGRGNDESNYQWPYKYKNLLFKPGIKTTGYKTENSGYCTLFNGSSSLFIPNEDQFNFKQDKDFAISLWINVPSVQSNLANKYNYIVSKEGEHQELTFNKVLGKALMITVPFTEGQYPYTIRYDNIANKIYCGRSDGYVSPFVTSSVTVTPSTDTHILFQKTGSLLQLYLNGIKQNQVTDNTTLNTHNKSYLFLGTQNVSGSCSPFTGSIDEFRIYNKALTQNQITSLANNDYMTGSAYNSPVVGNIFAQQGMITVSSPRPVYRDHLFRLALSGSNNVTVLDEQTFDILWQSTVQKNELQVLCRIKDDELNNTLNPSILKYGDSQLIQNQYTSSQFMPYFSNVGIYNQNGELLMIGTLSGPLQKRSDVDMNIILRLDM